MRNVVLRGKLPTLCLQSLLHIDMQMLQFTCTEDCNSNSTQLAVNNVLKMQFN